MNPKNLALGLVLGMCGCAGIAEDDYVKRSELTTLERRMEILENNQIDLANDSLKNSKSIEMNSEAIINIAKALGAK